MTRLTTIAAALLAEASRHPAGATLIGIAQ
jgi:hypothetical protein